MSRLIATRISDEQYSKIMGKCAGLGCSVYDYLKMLVETDITETKETTRADQKQTGYGLGDQERARRIRKLLEGPDAIDKENERGDPEVGRRIKELHRRVVLGEK